MRVSRAQAAENRQTVIDTAGRLFREHGFDGIGLKDLMHEAGLTQGAFYKQFASKEDLIAQATGRALETAEARWVSAVASRPQDPLSAVVDFYLSPQHRDQRMEGCPVVALGGEVARKGPDVKAPFEAGVRAHLAQMADILGETEGPGSKAMTTLATMVGAMVLSRAVNDERLSMQLLQSARESILADRGMAEAAPKNGTTQ
jgi:TetR/AcrR family transcriptional repressor of nem operon